jgi:hypothetical protein
MAHFKLKQKNHVGTDPYYAGTGMYFGFIFNQIGEDLVAEGEEDAFASLVKAKKVTKLSANALKELKAEAKEAEE